MMKILYSLGGIIAGILILKYSPMLLNFFGKSEDAESIFGAGFGGTYTVIKILGLVVVTVSTLFLFGIF
jgi:hypothetical protein